MSYESQIRECIQQLGARNGIAGLTLRPDAAVGLRLRNGSEIYLRFLSGLNRLYLYAIVAPLRAQRTDLLFHALASNCLEADGGVISISEPLNAFVYHLGFPVEMLTVERLEDDIEAFEERSRRVARQFEAFR